jgi:hypothetical protein
VGNRDVVHGLSTRSEGNSCFVHTESGPQNWPDIPTDIPEDPKNPVELTSKSERSRADRTAPMGVGAADVVGRLAASLGELDAVAPDFTPALDVVGIEIRRAQH